eukprot:TRINITY_DN42147_c0_g1_i1.p1 TRINITY_DN42147_c0_g1~~TRINITY_DN42147_c0_g1_i1.p1  ORF type:complete len:393 (-),score=111.73 TRINITY_DN42147_c0_g1_i1:62-1240(-)
MRADDGSWRCSCNVGRRRAHAFRRHAVSLSALAIITTSLLLRDLGTRAAFLPRAPLAGFLARRQLLQSWLVGAWLPATAVASTDVQEPTQQEQAKVGLAFMKLNEGTAEGLLEAESDFSWAIDRWKVLQRPSGERGLLLIGRARARIERNERAGGKLQQLLQGAIADLTEAIEGIRNDQVVPALNEKGRATFQEFPDALVRRGLAHEGLAQWEAALADYSEAIKLWGGVANDFRPGEFSEGGRLGVNPYVMTYRGNVLARLGRYDDALEDYQVAISQFTAVRDFDSLAVSLSNEALALYGAGQIDAAEQKMRSILRKSSGLADMHVALASIKWRQGKLQEAESEWQYACEKTEEGCQRYKDSSWVRGVRNWPPQLVEELERFLTRKTAAAGR